MNSGIYALYWEKTDLIYIGQSQDLIRRKKEHFKEILARTHSNYKIQKAYIEYGLPEFIILEYCYISQLNELEIYWQKEFNSLSSLDIVVAGQVGYGPYSNASKYSKITVLKVFSLLFKNDLKSSSKIAVKCRLPENSSLVEEIRNGGSHLWLKEVYPIQYAKMRSINYRSQATWGTLHRDVPYPLLISPDGLKVSVDESVTNTAKLIQDGYYPEDSVEVIRKGISRVLSGSRKQWRGWVPSIS